jgi:hypothetical protein
MVHSDGILDSLDGMHVCMAFISPLPSPLSFFHLRNGFPNPLQYKL